MIAAICAHATPTKQRERLADYGTSSEEKERMKAHYISMFIKVPDEGETEAWQVEQAIRDAAEEHLWQIVSLTVTNDETGDAGR